MTVLSIDPPWPMYGDPNKNAAAGKHYDLMAMDEINALPIKEEIGPDGIAFVWATCPRLDLAIQAIEAWGLNYRGVAFVWVKTRKDGAIIHGQGVPPTTTKPTTELCLAATAKKRGRPKALKDFAVPQVVLAPRGRHSQKPEVFQDHMESLFDGPYVEYFARRERVGWTCRGNEVSKPILRQAKSQGDTPHD